MKRRKAAIANYFGLTKHRFTSCLPAQGLKRDISFGLSGEIVNLPGISLLTKANFLKKIITLTDVMKKQIWHIRYASGHI